jgi:pyrroline-5-carboxylate reductase
MTKFPNLAFLGAGQLAEALVRGLLHADLVRADGIMMTDIRPQRLEAMAALGVRTSPANRDALAFGELVFLTVKPQDVPTVLAEIGPLVSSDHVIVSVAAGVPIARIQAALPGRTPVVRVMPNTPCLVGQGMAVVAAGPYATEREEQLVLRIFNAVGRALSQPESRLDAVTALSGSGPAFFSVILEAFIDAGVRVGLPRDVATELAVQTALGTAKMLLESGRHTGQLKDMVTSPGGTAIAGLHQLERGGLRGLIMDCVVAATERSRELGRAAQAEPTAETPVLSHSTPRG